MRRCGPVAAALATLLLAACGGSAKVSGAPPSAPRTAAPSTANSSIVASVSKAEATIKTALTQAQPALQQAAGSGSQEPYQFVKVDDALTQAAGQIIGIEAGPYSNDATAFADATRQLQSDFNQPTVDLVKANSDLGVYGTAANRYNQDLGIS